ncbi:MAG TPA: amidase family protein [Acidimicrobiales bacterium]|nr:amidase family protein [Acidimicrobiales bacterium]
MSMATAAELADALARGTTDSQSIIRRCLERIEAFDGYFAAIRLVAPDAMGQAAASDEHRRQDRPRRPLEGIPVVIKDNIDVAGLPTTAGALALADRRPEGDAPLVSRLRESGAVIIAKANLTELANFMTEGMPSGYSSIGGQVLNPYDVSITPGGSSSGSAAAVALGMAPLAIGTETDGSIINPASQQSLVGFKPTLGLVSRTGVFPISPSQDTAGPMATTVADAAALLAAIAGPDPADPATAEAAAVTDELRRLVLDPDVLGTARLVAVVQPTMDEQASGGPASEHLAALRQHGAVVGAASLQQHKWEEELTVLRYEFSPAIDAYFRRGGQGSQRSLADIRAWNLDHAEAALKYGQVTVDAALAVDHAAERAAYEETRRRNQAQAIDAMEEALGGGDALVFRGDAGATWAARAGWPSVTVPVGYSRRSHHPRALTLVSRRWSDCYLLSLAAGVERACGHRRPPEEINPAVFSRLPTP